MFFLRLTAKPTTIDLPLQIFWGKAGKKLVAGVGVGGGAETAAFSRSRKATGSMTDGQIEDATGIAEWGAEVVVICRCYSKQRATG